MNKKIITSIYFVVVAFIIVILAKLLLIKYFDYMSLKHKIKDVKANIYSLSNSNKLLKTKLKESYSLIDIERKARVKLQMVKDKEILVNIIYENK